MRKISDIEYCLSRMILNANHSHLHGIDKHVMAFSLIRRMKDPLSRYFLQHPKISTIYVLLNQSVLHLLVWQMILLIRLPGETNRCDLPSGVCSGQSILIQHQLQPGLHSLDPNEKLFCQHLQYLLPWRWKYFLNPKHESNHHNLTKNLIKFWNEKGKIS